MYAAKGTHPQSRHWPESNDRSTGDVYSEIDLGLVIWKRTTNPYVTIDLVSSKCWAQRSLVTQKL
ncbi:hypothetical protein CY34DRAFT_806591 [Suillus luteus UH-Slu-Lm8-n1]|uniref:Uncharacterized protein n=1 Tax=Suillus luteus UH-Slu-Lm8-n1 TaxID=930992 RepID=A0A0D0AGU9_9AGAM|nr:hypothetical protein CY34DRAFT_806591 [Suillus luteus UH-Slu-Lm8-n1]